MYESQPLPFLALVGHPESAWWSDAAVGFVAFYHRLRKGASIFDAVKAMKCASGDQGFEVRIGTAVQGDYVSFLNQQRIEQQRQALREYLDRYYPSRTDLQTNPRGTGGGTAR